MRKLRILHIGNGAAFKIRAIVEFMRDRGHEMHFIPTPPSPERWEGVEYHVIPARKAASRLDVVRRMLEARRVVREVAPDIVHAHNARGPGWYGAFTGRHPFVIHAYGSDLMPYYYDGSNRFGRFLTSYACRKADRLVVTGEHMIEASGHLRIPREKITVLPRGVDTSRFTPGLDTAALREELGIGNAGPVVFSPRYQIDEALYNFDTIIESIPLVRERYPRVLYIQLYEGARSHARAPLEEMAARLGVAENYRMVESVGNARMPMFYNLADAVVSVTSTDGFPVTVLEASACGAPMVVTKLDYTKEWFVDGENGLLIGERDPGELAGAVMAILGDLSLREKMARINRAQVLERADYGTCMKRLESMYYELLGRSD